MESGVPMFGAYVFTIILSFIRIVPFINMELSFLSLLTNFVLKPALSDMCITTPAYFRLHLLGNIFLSSTLSLSLSLSVSCVSSRQ
jgi:hypothetical protein